MGVFCDVMPKHKPPTRNAHKPQHWQCGNYLKHGGEKLAESVPEVRTADHAPIKKKKILDFIQSLKVQKVDVLDSLTTKPQPLAIKSCPPTHHRFIVWLMWLTTGSHGGPQWAIVNL